MSKSGVDGTVYASESTEVNHPGAVSGNDLDNTFEQLLGRAPSDEEKQILYRIKTALRLRDQDSIWAILMALGNFQFLYREHPKAIATAGKANATELREAGKVIASEMLAAAAAAAAKVADAGAAETARLEAKSKELAAKASASHADNQRAMVEAVREGAIGNVRQALAGEKFKWAAMCIIVSFAALMSVGWWAKRTAREEGFSAGYATAISTCQGYANADAWLKTAEGRMAYSLANAAPGTIAMLGTCSSPGWKIMEGQCCPLTGVRNAKCWRLPPR
jgi:hypothetical protein